jgi:hypothetical protein
MRASSKGNPGEPITRQSARAMVTASSRVVGGGWSRAALAWRVGGLRAGSGVDMIEVRLRTRPGWAMASAWAIIPPIEIPTTWAESRPRPSSRPAVSSAMSDTR